MRDVFHTEVGENLNSGLMAFRFEHTHDLLRRAIAEKLSQSFFVICDAMLLDQLDEICRGVSRERRFGEVRISGDEVFRLTVKVGEVAATATGNQNLFPDAPGAFQHRRPPAPLPCLYGAHEPSRTAADNNYIQVVCHDQRWPRAGGDSACRSDRKSGGTSHFKETVSPERG